MVTSFTTLKRIGLSLLLVLSTSTVSYAEKLSSYAANSDLSQISFNTIKKQYVVETATIGNISGTINTQGQAIVKAKLGDIKTGVPIRDQRLNQLFFKSHDFPAITISSDLSQYQMVKAPSMDTQALEFVVSLYGHSQKITADVLITNLGNQLLVSSRKPIVIKASDFGVPVANLTALSSTVGGLPISTQVPVNFSLVFDRQ